LLPIRISLPLLTAINNAGLGDALTTLSVSTLTPINEAFAALEPAFLAFLLTPEWDLHFVNLLGFHLTAV